MAQEHAHLSACDLCGWQCKVDRFSDKLGVCRSSETLKLSRYGAHMGEEHPLRGWRGSGTIFFTRCSLRCQYCQNHDISQTDSGYLVQPSDLASVMLALQKSGCHNINLVSPTHFAPQIMAALLFAVQAGLRLPLVYNTNSYDSLETLILLDGVIDIYMPDMKYASIAFARKYSKIPNYFQINQNAVREMHRQVGDLEIDSQGIALRGLLVRHLVLPNNLAGTSEILRFLAGEISTNTYINIMNQYHPALKAHQFPALIRRISTDKHQAAIDTAHQFGLHRLDH